jgi:hypothetical protein
MPAFARAHPGALWRDGPKRRPMIELTALAVLAVTVAAIVATVAVVMVMLKAILWIVLLPFRLLFGLILLPLVLLKVVVGGLLLVVVGPIVALALIAGVVAVGAVLVLP